DVKDAGTLDASAASGGTVPAKRFSVAVHHEELLPRVLVQEVGEMPGEKADRPRGDPRALDGLFHLRGPEAPASGCIVEPGQVRTGFERDHGSVGEDVDVGESAGPSGE